MGHKSSNPWAMPSAASSDPVVGLGPVITFFSSVTHLYYADYGCQLQDCLDNQSELSVSYIVGNPAHTTRIQY